MILRFHQSIMTLPDVKHFLTSLSAEFEARNGDGLNLTLNRSLSTDPSSANLFSNTRKYPSTFNLTADATPTPKNSNSNPENESLSAAAYVVGIVPEPPDLHLAEASSASIN